MKKLFAIAATLAAGAFAMLSMNAAEAHGGVSLSIGVGVPFVGVAAPVYAPPPAYYAAPPVVYAPAPVYVAPPVRYAPAYGYRYAPAPVVYGGWGADRARWEHERFERERWAREHAYRGDRWGR